MTPDRPAEEQLGILLIEDNDDHAELVGSCLSDVPLNFRIQQAKSLKEAAGLAAETDASYDAVLLDLGLPESKGLASLQKLLALDLDLPVVVMTAQHDADIGVEAVRMGAQDFIVKFPKDRLGLYRALAFAIERKRITDEIERRRRMLQTFAAAVGHDLTSPPRHILALVEMLESDEGDALTPSVRKRIEQIRDRAERMTLLLKDVLSYARLGGAELDRKTVQLRDLVQAVVDDLDPEDRDRVTCVADRMLVVDPSLMYLALRNLIFNGLKYWRDTPSRVTVDAEEMRGDVLITVRDTGIGIDPIVGDNIFMPGKRAVRSEEFTGTGYGLAICKEAIEAHSGTIWYGSDIGSGTIFHIRLPARFVPIQIGTALQPVPE